MAMASAATEKEKDVESKVTSLSALANCHGPELCARRERLFTLLHRQPHRRVLKEYLDYHRTRRTDIFPDSSYELHWPAMEDIDSFDAERLRQESQESQNERNATTVVIVLFGPVGSPYEGGEFRVEMQLPRAYPFTPPIPVLRTPIYHCNWTAHMYAGRTSMAIEKDDWNPSKGIVHCTFGALCVRSWLWFVVVLSVPVPAAHMLVVLI